MSDAMKLNVNSSSNINQPKNTPNTGVNNPNDAMSDTGYITSSQNQMTKPKATTTRN